MRIQPQRQFIEPELRQSHEFKGLIEQAQYFPNDFVLNLSKELRLLAIPGAVLTEEQFVDLHVNWRNVCTAFFR